MKQEIKKEKYQTEGEIPMICEVCNYAWFVRKQKPRQCPNCKRQIKYAK